MPELTSGAILTSVVNAGIRPSPLSPPPPPPPIITTTTPWFALMDELFHDGGGNAQQTLNDKMITGVTFHAVLAPGEITFLNNNPTAAFGYFAIPSSANVASCYPSSTDDNAGTVLSAYTRYPVWRLGAPEFDQGGGCWATGRPGFTGTDTANYSSFTNYYLNTKGLGAAGLNQIAAVRGYKWMGVAVFSANAQYAYDMGMDMVLIERNIDEVDGMSPGLAIVRGAANQNGGKDWGIDFSSWRTWCQSPTQYSNGNLTAGWSTSTFNRNLMIAYMGGANVIHMEAIDYTTGAASGQTYNPLGLLMQQVYSFAVTRHPNRGAPYVPMVIMQDHYSGLVPKYGEFNQIPYKWYTSVPYTPGDTMLSSLWSMIYPNYNLWGSLVPGSPRVNNPDGSLNFNASITSYSNAVASGRDPRPWEPMASAKWGETFDVVTNQAALATLTKYKVVILATGVAMSDALLSTLTQYVSQGGALVVNALQLSANAQTLAGVTLGGRSTATSEIWVPDGSTINENSYNYTIVTPTTAAVIAKTSGNPVVTQNLRGSGTVYVTTPDYMSDAGNQILLVGAKLIDLLQQTFAVATVSVTGPGLDYLINRDGNRTIVTLINTDLGGAAWNGTISFRQPFSSYSQEWTTDTQASFSMINSQAVVPASVPGYGVHVYAFGTP